MTTGRCLLGASVIVVLFYEYTVGLVFLFLSVEWFPYIVPSAVAKKKRS
jgi:hypothetical protein